MGKHRFDVAIVGSGATGGAAAMALTAAGLDVALLEAGSALQFGRDPQEGLARRPIQRKCPGCDAHGYAQFVDDIDNPYTTPADAPFDWFRCRVVGGRMHVWSRFALRLGEREFADWPITYAEVAPYYAAAERMLGVVGRPDGIAVVPDGAFEPIDASPYHQFLERELGTHRPEWRVIVARRAMASTSPLDRATASGRLTLRTDAVVDHVIVDRGRATGVQFIDRNTREPGDVHARCVFLCASAIESARILLCSKIGGASVGRYMMDHVHSGVLLHVPTASDVWQAHGGLISRSYIPAAEGRTEPRSRYGIQAIFGELPLPNMPQPLLRLRAFGEMLPRAENSVTLDPNVRDAWGIPAAHIRCVWSEHELELVRHQLTTMTALARDLGAVVVQTDSVAGTPGSAAHEIGTARMGSDPATSALDPSNRCWDVPNVFVTDGSAFVSSGSQNPTLTMIALTLRACDRAVEQLRNRD